MPHTHRCDGHHPGGQRCAIGRLDIFDLSRRVTRSPAVSKSAESHDYLQLARVSDGRRARMCDARMNSYLLRDHYKGY